MLKKDLEDLEKEVVKEVVKRRSLGGYSTEADGLLLDGEFLLKIMRHLIDQAKKK